MPEDTNLGMVGMFLDEHFLHCTCVKQIYCKVYKHNRSDSVPIWESKRIVDILRNLGWVDIGSRKFRGYGSQRAWEPKDLPSRITE